MYVFIIYMYVYPVFDEIIFSRLHDLNNNQLGICMCINFWDLYSSRLTCQFLCQYQAVLITGLIYFYENLNNISKNFLPSFFKSIILWISLSLFLFLSPHLA